MSIWNPWHGCHKKSQGCLNCYMFRRDAMYDKDSEKIEKTKDFNLGIKKHRDGTFFIPDNDIIYTCMTSDFFIEEADNWRNDIWQIIKYRKNVNFVIITKRIERFMESIPNDWGLGYDNVTIICTVENQDMADKRLPIFINLPIKHREIIHEPMLESIDIDKYLKTGLIESVTCGGESGDNARICNYDWILNTRRQCIENDVTFYFKQTGANFIKNGKLYKIKRIDQIKQANIANINYKYNIFK